MGPEPVIPDFWIRRLSHWATEASVDNAIKRIQLFARIYEGADLYHDMNLLSGARSYASGAHFQNRAGFTPTCYSSLPYTFPKISSIVNPLQCLFAPAVQKVMEREKIEHSGTVGGHFSKIKRIKAYVAL